jgi:hypothetical protein
MCPVSYNFREFSANIFLRDVGDHGDRHALRAPTRPFSISVANKSSSAIRRLGDPWVALAWPLRGPWVAQG